MTKRERRILILMAVVVCLGVYALFFKPSEEPLEGKKPDSVEKINQFVIGVANSLSKEDALSGTDFYIITKAAMEWTDEPFASPPASKRKNITGRPLAAAPANAWRGVYSGYLETTDRKLAIIDGVEYEVGDTLTPSGYVVLSISPTRTIIGRKGTIIDLKLKSEETPLSPEK
jgi:hypothetical protein